MTDIVVLNSVMHRDLRVNFGSTVGGQDSARFVAVVLSEFASLVTHYPLFFSKDANTGAFYCGAMLGFHEGENLFLSKHYVHDAYRPLNLQRGPFYVAGAEVAIDLESPMVSHTIGDLLFSDKGTATPFLERMSATLRAIKQGLDATKAFIDTLLQFGLIEEIALDLAFDDGTRLDVEGLYTVSQDALARLPDASVLELFRHGYLKLVYMIIASVQQVNVLAQRKNRALIDAV